MSGMSEPERMECVDKAADMYASEDCEIDGDAEVSRGEYGTWVQAWVWVPDDDSQDNEEK